MSKIIFLSLSVIYSSVCLSASLKDVMWEISVDGNTGDFVVGSGMKIAENIVLTVSHLIQDDEVHSATSEVFVLNETVGKNRTEGHDFTEHVVQTEGHVAEDFKSVLVVNNRKNIFVITSNGDKYFANKVVDSVQYDQNDAIENDPICILFLSSTIDELPSNMKTKFFSKKWSTVGARTLPSLQICFSTMSAENEPWTLSECIWEKNSESLVIVNNKASSFVLAPLHVAGGMSGGGLFVKERFVGIFSSTVSSVETSRSLGSCSIVSLEEYFKKYSWNVKVADLPGPIPGEVKIESTDGFYGASIKIINFESLNNVLRCLSKRK